MKNPRIPGILILVGLAVEALSLAAHGPSAFLVFAGVGALALVAGMGLYLLSLVR